MDSTNDEHGTAVRHVCHAPGCRTGIPPRYLMCRRHWAMVPPGVQAMVWDTYRPGQEVDKRPSRPWKRAAWLAKAAVCEAQGNPDGAAFFAQLAAKVQP